MGCIYFETIVTQNIFPLLSKALLVKLATLVEGDQKAPYYTKV